MSTLTPLPQISPQDAFFALYASGVFGSRSLRRLERYFPQLGDVLTASAPALQAAGIRPKAAATFIAKRHALDIPALRATVAGHGLAIVDWHDAAYPRLLKEVPDPPPVLLVRGNLDALHRPAVALVGSRRTTPYGERAAAFLARDVVGAGLAVTSGLALGIDACAHRAAVAAGGITVAVLGSGLDDASLYPRANFGLAHDILANEGALVSEYLPGTPGLPHHFPQRNRIVAGLTRATVVVEAGEKSGALITARLALDYNREALAVPGNIFSLTSQGTHALLRQGAAIAASAADILEAIGAPSRQSAPLATAIGPARHRDLAPTEAKIAGKLGPEPMHINMIGRLTKLDTAGLNATLSLMEIKGIIKNNGGGNYILL